MLPAGSATTTTSTTSKKAPSLDAVRHGRAVIEAGEHGKSVRKLQLIMNDVFDRDVKVDGTFGGAMEKRLETFQHQHHLAETGKLNKSTLKLLEDKLGPDRSRSQYADVLAKVNPMAAKYLPHNGSTFCNVFAEDVTAKMGAPLPRMMANDLNTWLKGPQGKKAGWHQVTAAEAQRLANEGHPTVASWHNDAGIHGHIAMVRPGSMAGPGNPATAQAGARNFLHGHMRDGFGSVGPVLYFTHD